MTRSGDSRRLARISARAAHRVEGTCGGRITRRLGGGSTSSATTSATMSTGTSGYRLLRVFSNTPAHRLKNRAVSSRSGRSRRPLAACVLPTAQPHAGCASHAAATVRRTRIAGIGRTCIAARKTARSQGTVTAYSSPAHPYPFFRRGLTAAFAHICWLRGQGPWGRLFVVASGCIAPENVDYSQAKPVRPVSSHAMRALRRSVRFPPHHRVESYRESPRPFG